MTAATHVPPQDEAAEKATLGSMLVTTRAVESVLDEVGLEPVDFYLDRHQVIFGAIRDLRESETPIDEITVSDALRVASKIDEAGGQHYVSELAAMVPAASLAKHYAEIVRRCAGEYRLLLAGQGIVTSVNGREAGPLELAQKAAKAIEDASVRGGLASIRTADISRVQPIRHAWQRRLIVGYLNLLLGAEGIGKSTLIAWLIAQFTRGNLPGDLQGEPVRVLILGDEDAFDSVWVPRLYAAGADLDLVDVLEEEFDVSVGSGPMRQLVGRNGYRVFFFDQLLDNLGIGADDWRQGDIRNRLRPLRRVVRDLEVVAVASLHPNKGAKTSFRDLVSGTVAFNALSRSSLLLAPHPEDDGRRVLVRGKGNLSAPPPSFEFEIQGRDLEINGHGFSLPVVADTDEGELTVEDLVKPQREAPVRSGLADEIDSVGTGEPQKRAEIAQILGRSSDDRSVGRALDQLEDEGRWEKLGRGLWRRSGLALAPHRGVPMSNSPADGVRVGVGS